MLGPTGLRRRNSDAARSNSKSAKGEPQIPPLGRLRRPELKLGTTESSVRMTKRSAKSEKRIVAYRHLQCFPGGRLPCAKPSCCCLSSQYLLFWGFFRVLS